MRGIRIFRWAVAALAILAASVALTSGATAADKKIKIGVIYDYTGPLAGGGSDLQALVTIADVPSRISIEDVSVNQDAETAVLEPNRTRRDRSRRRKGFQVDGGFLAWEHSFI